MNELCHESLKSYMMTYRGGVLEEVFGLDDTFSSP